VLVLGINIEGVRPPKVAIVGAIKELKIDGTRRA